MLETDTIINESRVKQILKEELDLAMKAFEIKLTQSMFNEHSIIHQMVNSHGERYDKVSSQLHELNNMVNTDKVNVDRIEDLLQFQRRATDQINSHELRIGNLQKTLTSACYKYDKIFIDNLQIPGTIGDYCRFKNMKEYIDVTYK
jgi:hypothetical protein